MISPTRPNTSNTAPPTQHITRHQQRNLARLVPNLAHHLGYHSVKSLTMSSLRSLETIKSTNSASFGGFFSTLGPQLNVTEAVLPLTSVGEISVPKVFAPNCR